MCLRSAWFLLFFRPAQKFFSSRSIVRLRTPKKVFFPLFVEHNQNFHSAKLINSNHERGDSFNYPKGIQRFLVITIRKYFHSPSSLCPAFSPSIMYAKRAGQRDDAKEEMKTRSLASTRITNKKGNTKLGDGPIEDINHIKVYKYC